MPTPRKLKAEPKTPAAAASASVSPESKEFKLPSGRIATDLPFKGKHVRQASRLAKDGDEITAGFALITACTLIDGKAIVIEELEEMDGKDVLFLLDRFSGLF